MWVNPDTRRLSAAIVGLALLAAPNAIAEDNFVDQLLPPDGLRGDYNDENRTIMLEWNPPASDADTPFTYRVYRNTVLIGETQETWYAANLVGGLNVFQVTASHNGNESVRSQPVVAQQQSSGGGGNPTAAFASTQLVDVEMMPKCEILIITTYTQWPYVAYGIREHCIPIIGPSLAVPGPADSIVFG